MTEMPSSANAPAGDAQQRKYVTQRKGAGDTESIAGVAKEQAFPEPSTGPSPVQRELVSQRVEEPEPRASSAPVDLAPSPGIVPPGLPQDGPEKEQGESAYLMALWKSQVRGIMDMALKAPPEVAHGDKSLKTTYLLRISVNGDLQDERLLVSSGNAGFDRSVQLALESARKLPLPPVSLMAGRESIEITVSFAPPEGK